MSDLGNKQVMANNIKKYMSLFNKTRVEICNDLNISYTTFSDWVNAKTYPRIDKIELLANYFGIEKSDLVEKRDSPLGDYNANVEFLKDKPELLELYKEIVENDQLVILFDKARKLEPKDLEQVLKIIDTFNKETKWC